MAELSPAAQAVLDAADDAIKEWPPVWEGAIAAALRAAADQVVHHWDGMECVDHLQAIAAELEGAKAEPPRRHVFPTPHQIAECGGPCEQGGPEACDCGLYERSASKSTHLEIGDE